MQNIGQRKKVRTRTPKGHTRKRTGTILELSTTAAYRRAGWEVYQGGWPDLLCIRRRFDGTLEAQLVECKAGKGNHPRPLQKRMHAALRALGFNVIVENGTLRGRPWMVQ